MRELLSAATKLVIMAGCSTAANNAFPDALGITNNTVGHAFIGVNSSVNNGMANIVVDLLFQKLGQGETIGQALQEVQAKTSAAKNFVIIGDKNVRL